VFSIMIILKKMMHTNIFCTKKFVI